MCSTRCALGIGGEYFEHQLLVATGVVSRPCRRFGGGDKII